MEKADGSEGGGSWSRWTGLPEGGLEGPEQDVEYGAGRAGPVMKEGSEAFGQYKREVLDLHSGDRQRRWRGHLRTVEFPDSTPHFRDLKVDREGNLWIQRYRPFWSREDHEWQVFGRNGTHLATTTVPLAILGPCATTRLSPCDPILEIGSDYVLIRHKDDLGVERVKRHRLERGAG